MNNPCITIDVEDWLQSTWDRALPVSSVAGENTLRLLYILDELSIKTTMFIQGKFAETFPDIVKKINKHGHEIASHGFAHIEIFKQDRKEFKADLLDSKKLLEDLTSQKIIGYRAPDFSILRDNTWALEVLSEMGFEYDSSIFPVQHSRYGIHDFSLAPVRIKLNNGLHITEYPLTAFTLFGRNIPVSGGGYHRLLPGYIFRRIASKIMEDRPFIFYCHPYEINSNEFSQMSIKIPLMKKIHQASGRRFFEDRFRKFITTFGAQTINELHLNSLWAEISIDKITN